MSGRVQSIGSFCFYFEGERWEWSDAVARMHGYEPGEVTPTTELLLQHKHPDDRESVADLLQRVLHDGESFSSRHRIIDTTGHVHYMVVVAHRIMSEGHATGTSGFYVDVTNSVQDDTRRVLAEKLPEVVEARATIEQAKGVLMAVYGIDADHAFEVLVWCSQESNVKLRVIAEQLVAALPTAVKMPPDLRSRFDHLLLSVGHAGNDEASQ